MERKKQDGKCFEINVREYRKGNQKQTMQRNWLHRELNVTKKSLKIPKGQSESVYRRRTDNTMAKRKSTKGQTTIYKTCTYKIDDNIDVKS